MKRIHKVKTAIIVKDTIPDEKVEILRDNCNNLRDRAMIDFLLSTGIRVGELVRLNIDDIDYFKEETGFTEYALSAIMASRDKEKVKKVSIKSKSGRRLAYLGYEDDVNLCVKENISENVGIYKDGKISLYNE